MMAIGLLLLTCIATLAIPVAYYFRAPTEMLMSLALAAWVFGMGTATFSRRP